MKAKKTKTSQKTTAKLKSKPKTAPRKVKPSPRLLCLLVAALESKKAEELRVLHVGNLSSITDYLVLATGTSEPHLRAMRIEVERVFDEEKTRILGVETIRGSGWTVVDAFDVMVHLFTPENRGKYRMESLWKDAEEMSLVSLQLP